MPAPPAAPTAEVRSRIPRWLVVGSWALYDLANTIFSAIVITRYFIPYMHARAVPGIWVSTATVLSMLAAGIASPYAGVLLDRHGKGRTLLFLSTLACVALTALLSAPAPSALLLAVYAGANFFYNLALVFYNAFLPHLGPPESQGRISGLGVGVGYLGLIPAIILASGVVKATGSEASVFALAAAAFLVLSVPAFITLPRLGPTSAPRTVSPARQLLHTAREVWRDRRARLFFLGNFLCTDVLNSLILWIFVYVEEVFRLDAGEKDRYQMAMVVSNILCSFLAGWLCDRFTSRKAFLLSAACLLAALLVAGLTESKAVLFWTTVPLAGFGLGGIWTAGRKLLFALSPPEKLGEFSGLYGLTGKVSSITTLLYGGLSRPDDAPSHRAALLSLVPLVLAGLWLIARMEEPPSERRRPR